MILEARGFQVVLVNARHVKNVPGRKSDVSDCEWLQELHSVGLLRPAFARRPRSPRCGPTCVITGVRGLRILRDIVAERRDPQALAEHRDYRCAASQEQIIAALRGTISPSTCLC